MAMGWSYEKAAAEVVKSGQLLCGGNVTNGKPDDVEALRRARSDEPHRRSPISTPRCAAACASASVSAIWIRRAACRYRSLTGNENPWNTAEYKARALDVSRRTVVLLKNADNALPLSKTALKNVAVIGPRADQIIRDWYAGKPPYTAVTALAGIKAKLGTGVTVTFAADNTNSAAVNAARAADVAIVVVGPHPICGNPEDTWAACPASSMGYEGREGFDADRTHIGLMPDQETLVRERVRGQSEDDRRAAVGLPARRQVGWRTTCRRSSTSRTAGRRSARRSPTSCSATTTRAGAPR